MGRREQLVVAIVMKVRAKLKATERQRGLHWGISAQRIEYVFSSLSWINKWLTVGDKSHEHPQENIGKVGTFHFDHVYTLCLLFSC